MIDGPKQGAGAGGGRGRGRKCLFCQALYEARICCGSPGSRAGSLIGADNIIVNHAAGTLIYCVQQHEHGVGAVSFSGCTMLAWSFVWRKRETSRVSATKTRRELPAACFNGTSSDTAVQRRGA